jgi:hypothetical protein
VTGVFVVAAMAAVSAMAAVFVLRMRILRRACHRGVSRHRPRVLMIVASMLVRVMPVIRH